MSQDSKLSAAFAAEDPAAVDSFVGYVFVRFRLFPFSPSLLCQSNFFGYPSSSNWLPALLPSHQSSGLLSFCRLAYSVTDPRWSPGCRSAQFCSPATGTASRHRPKRSQTVALVPIRAVGSEMPPGSSLPTCYQRLKRITRATPRPPSNTAQLLCEAADESEGINERGQS